MKMSPPVHRRRRGMAVIVMLALLSIMLVSVAATVRSLGQLHRELNLLDQKQNRRLNASALIHRIETNSAPATVSP